MADRDFSNGQNAPMPHFGNNFAFEATQVIYSGGALKSAQEMAETGEMIAESQLELTRQQVRLMIAGYYLDLFRMENQKVVYRNNNVATESNVTNYTICTMLGIFKPLHGQFDIAALL